MKAWKIADYLNGFVQQDRVALARAVTLVESTHPDHKKLAQELLTQLPHKPQVRRIGISGTPGVGKSSFIEVFGTLLTQKNYRVAVLAVDPTSQLSGGSILGDKTRMESLSKNPLAFIRPTPSGGTLGGVARRTREVLRLCEAFGFDYVLVETVGVGQSETAVSRMVDCFMMLLQPGAGDDLQGIKRGILELVDLVVITKADGDTLSAAEAAQRHYQQALHILRQEAWHPPVLACSSLERRGFEGIFVALEAFFQQLGPQLAEKRSRQSKDWFDEALALGLEQWFVEAKAKNEIEKMRLAVERGETSVALAVEKLLKLLN